MSVFVLVLFVVFVSVKGILPDVDPNSATVIHAFHWINISFPNPTQAEWYIQNEVYKNVTMNGLKVDSNGDIYVSFPRWKDNTPITLAKLDQQTGLFHAYPSWEMNVNPDPRFGIQSVLGFEIDAKKRMWILDQSHIDSVIPAPEFGTKMIVFDMVSEEVLHIEYFDDSIAPVNSSFLNDVVVDMDRDVAYITDSGILSNPENPSVIVYDYANKKSKRLLVQQTSTVANASLEFYVDGNKCMETGTMMTGSDGIALSCDYEILYICPLTSRRVYGIETKYLRDLDDVNDKIISVGDKLSVSDGLVLGSKGSFFSGDIEHNGVLRTDENVMRKYVQTLTSSIDVLPSIHPVAKGNVNLWQDTFSISNGNLYWTTNDLCNWLQGKIDYSNINYRIWKLPIGEESYVYGCN